MTGYFDALMRSTGMAIGDEPRSKAPRDPGIGEIDEIDVEHRQGETPSHHPTTSSVPRLARTQVPVTHVMDTTDTTQRAADTIATPSVPATPAAHSGQPTPDLGQTLIRAAMKWVAADALPTKENGIRGVVTPPEQSARSRVAAPDPQHLGVRTAPPAGPDEIADAPAPRPNAPSIVPTTPHLGVPELVVKPAVPIREARPTPAALPALAQKAARDETVEISIGAIHVRVDAPATQTVASAAATPPPSARAASSARPRSALSRRAMRRI